ncbi:hypothetical protein F5878DRAFT_643049 [Lentinula raphanica]|uniref:Uncharacterized protein n=1 Tax=Lentinula raphanica TaxID=153919 RepID=A0AA38P6L4_9AGAR|nr:hypothetical protein F5878DRAFT_643049 [Lentinula raphanica]
MVAYHKLLLPLVVCLVALLTAHARPTLEARKQENSYWTEDNRERFLEWRREELMKNLQEHQSWINMPEAWTCPGMNKNGPYFSAGTKSTLIQEKLREYEKLTSGDNGGNSKDIYRVTRNFQLADNSVCRAKDNYIVKLVDISSSDEGKVASCEPYALEELGIWHRTGTWHDERSRTVYGAILIKQEPGKQLRDDQLWINASPEEKQKLLKSIRKTTKKKLHTYAFKTSTNVADRIMAYDISNENVPVDFEEGQSGLEVKGVAFKSWEYSKTVTCKSKQNLKDAGFSGWFDRQFDLYWALEYEEAGIPTVVDEFKRKIGH